MSTETQRSILNFLIGIAAILTVVAGAFAIWRLHPSERYFEPDFWAYNPEIEEVSFRRTINARAPILANWTHEIVTESGTLECSDSGRAPYEPFQMDNRGNVLLGENGLPIPKALARFPISDRLRPCVESGEGYYQRATWSVLWMGVVPLLPVELEQTFTLVPPALKESPTSKLRRLEGTP